MGEEKRHEMMATLFGAESEDSDDEPEVARAAASFQYDEGDDEEGDGDGEAEVESEAEPGRSEGEDRADNDRAGEGESDAEREVEVSASGSEHSDHARAVEDGEEEDVRGLREASEGGEDEQQGSRERVEVAEAREVFGESDEDEDQEHEVLERRSEESLQASPEARSEKGSEGEGVRPDDIVGNDEDEDVRYESDEEQQVERKREKPTGPPLVLELPLRRPPGRPDQMNLVRVSNIMDIDTKPFDPKTYEAEEMFVTDEVTGRKQRLRLEENVVRWRAVRNREGSHLYESNARFVKWSDGSTQLLLGSEVLDLSVQDARHDQSHLFLRHAKSVLQSQGRLVHKMKFMPSSLTSKSHRLLTALVDSRHKKVFKVKNVITTMDPEKEKEEKEKAAEQRIRSKEDLQRKQEKMTRKYPSQVVRDRELHQQLSPGYLEGALDEEDEVEEYTERRESRRFEEQLEAEERAERRIMSAKRQPPAREPLRRPKDRRAPLPKRDLIEDSLSEASERELSAYGSDHQDDDDDVGMIDRRGEEDEDEGNRTLADRGISREREEKRRADRDDDDRKRKREREEREPSPLKKAVQRRRVVVSDSEEED